LFSEYLVQQRTQGGNKVVLFFVVFKEKVTDHRLATIVKVKVDQ